MSDTALALQLKEANISESDSAILQKVFGPFFQEAEKWTVKANAIQVTSVDDKSMMKEARETRLALKEIRVNVEKARKELKEESLRKGKAIDGMANVIKFLIVPIEEHLEKQENFAKHLEEQKLQQLKAVREAELSQFGVDVTFYDLASMPEETFIKLLESSRLTFQMTKDAAEKVEQERIAKEKAESEERERIRVENERLRKEAEQQRAKLEEERQERLRIEADLRAKKEAEEKAAKEQEEQQRQAKLAPDKEKLVALADRIANVELPEVTSEEAKKVLKQTIELLSKASQFVRTQSINL